MKCSVIGDEDTVLGFGIVGVPGRIASTEEETRSAFGELLEDQEVSIIIITERLADKIRALVDRYMLTQSFPLIVEIPDRRGRLPGRPGIREMVNTAIGIKI
jgi:V/A-type H+-transporting ATPase subunit F